jgi:hypothetical protein
MKQRSVFHYRCSISLLAVYLLGTAEMRSSRQPFIRTFESNSTLNGDGVCCLSFNIHRLYVSVILSQT